MPAALSQFNDRLSIFATLTGYWTLILLFTILYRVSPIHPLANYSGPFLNKISKLRNVQVAIRGDLHRYYRTLFQQYGDIVRVGEYRHI